MYSAAIPMLVAATMPITKMMNDTMAISLDSEEDTVDYLDTDSDNEGSDDDIEAGITLSGTDTDGDGLDDATDASTGYSDPGGTIDDPLTGALILPDTNGIGDVDFRDQFIYYALYKYSKSKHLRFASYKA